MRFGCPHPARRITLRGQKIERLADGNVREVKHGLYAQFEPLSYTEREREALSAKFGDQLKKGARITEDRTGEVSQDWRIGIFDTDWVRDREDREQIEKLIFEHHRYDRDFMLLEALRAPKPWAKYDDLKVRGQRSIDKVAEQIVEIAQTIGVDQQTILDYERENLDRPEVIAAVEAMTETADEAVVVNA